MTLAISETGDDGLIGIRNGLQIIFATASGEAASCWLIDQLQRKLDACIETEKRISELVRHGTCKHRDFDRLVSERIKAVQADQPPARSALTYERRHSLAKLFGISLNG